MTATRINYSTLASEPFNNVYDVVNSRTNIADPIDPVGNRKFVYTREPDVNKAGFAGFPYIIVHDPDFVSSKQTTGNKSAQQDFSCELEIVTCDRGFGSTDGQGHAQLNNITDDCLKTFLNATVRGLLALNGLHFSNPKATKPVVEPFKETLVYRRTIMLSFRTRLAVSA